MGVGLTRDTAYGICNQKLMIVVQASVSCTSSVMSSLRHTCSNIIEMRNTHKDEFLKKHGVKLGFMAPFVQASCFALQDQPVVNAGQCASM